MNVEFQIKALQWVCTALKPYYMCVGGVTPQAKRANKVSKHSEWKGRKFIQKKILACPYRGRGMSVCLSVHPSVTVTLLNNFFSSKKALLLNLYFI
jgi:hypothetical protein